MQKHSQLILYIILFSIIIIFAYSYRYFFYDQILWEGDSADIFVPVKIFLKNQISQYNIPEWNPFTHGGIEHANFPTNQVFYPFTYIFLWFDIFHQIQLFQLFHIVLFGIGMMFFLKEFELNLFSAGIGTFVFIFSNYYISASGFLDIIATLTYFPWILICLFKWIKTFNYKYSITIGMLFGLQFLAGHPQYFYYTFLACMIILIIKFKSIFSKKISLVAGNLFAASVIFFVVASPLLLSFFNFVLNTPEFVFEKNSNLAGLKVLNLFNVIIPDFTGLYNESLRNLWLPLRKFYISNIMRYVEYAGILPIFFMFIFFKYSEIQSHIKIIVAVFFIFGLMITFYSLIFPMTLIKFIPMFSVLRYYERIFMFSLLALSISSAYVIGLIESKNVVIGKNIIFGLPVIVAASSAFFFILSLLNLENVFFFKKFFNAESSYRLNLYLNGLSRNLFFLFVELSLFSFALICLNKNKYRFFKIFCCCCFLIHIFFYPPNFISKKDFFKYLKQIDNLSKMTETEKPLNYLNFETVPDLSNCGFRTLAAEKPFWSFGGEHIRFSNSLYNFLYKSSYEKLYCVKYYVAQETDTTVNNKSFIWNDKTYFLKKYDDILSPVYSDEIKIDINDYNIVAKNSDNILINLTLENDALIILRHNYSPNWKLKVNKENVGILMRNRNFMAFYGKKGVNEIDFFYSDPLIKTGLGIWVLSGIILLLFSIFYYFKKITIA